MHVAVCIVGFRNAEEVAACIAAIGRSTHADYEVVICENGGAPAEAALRAALAPLPGGQTVTVVGAPDNPGYAGGVNRCLAGTPNADAWWVVNPDAEPEPQAMAALVARLSKGDVAAAGGTLYHPGGRVQAHGGHWRDWLARPESIGHGSPLATPADPAAIEAGTDYILGASMMIDRTFLDRVGPMREDYFLYGEEVEWFLRARALGLKLGFAPEARVQHGQGGTTGSAAAHHQRGRLPIYLDERNKLHIVRDTGAYRLVTAAPAAFALLALRYARRGAWKQWRYGVAGWWAGLKGERGKPDWVR